MNLAVVVVAPGSVIDSAVEWAQAGLVAPSLWINAETAPEVDPDQPNAIPVRVIEAKGTHRESTLARELAALGPVDETRVAWLRYSSDHDVAQMRSLADHLRELQAPRASRWLDIVVPERRTDMTVVPLAGTWVQFRIDPSDRPAPDAADAGWDRAIHTPLHVTLALTGILAGHAADLPWAAQSAQDYRVVRVFSRLIAGGAQADREAEDFTHRVLPSTQGGHERPAECQVADPSQASQILEAACDKTLALDDGALTYTPPPTSVLSPQPRVRNVVEHLRNIWRFVPTALLTMAGLKPSPDAQTGHILEFSDLGYSIGDPVTISKATSGIPDFSAQETALREHSRAVLARERGVDGELPSAMVWDPLCRITTALVDGGQGAPRVFEPPRLHDRQLTVAPQAVVLSQDDGVASTVPELRHAPSVAAAKIAVERARRSHPAPLNSGESRTRVTATAVHLTDLGNRKDSEILADQLRDLGEVGPSEHPPTFLDRVYGCVLGDRIRARLDAERWERLATSPIDDGLRPWDRHAPRVRYVVWAILVLLVVATALWIRDSDGIADALGLTLSLAAGLVVLTMVFLLMLLIAILVLFGMWAAYMERGRRRLELLHLWLGRAQMAWASHRAQVNTDRATRAWTELLSQVPGDPTTPPAPSTLPTVSGSPEAMRLAQPRPRETTQRRLAAAASTSGYRLACLEEVIAQTSRTDTEQALAWLTEDRSALPGGRIDTVLTELPATLPAWRARRGATIAAVLRDRLSRNTEQVEVSRVAREGEKEILETSGFFEEITPVDDSGDDQMWPDDSRHSWICASPMCASNGDIHMELSQAMCGGRVRIQVASHPPHPQASDTNAPEVSASVDAGHHLDPDDADWL